MLSTALRYCTCRRQVLGVHLWPCHLMTTQPKRWSKAVHIHKGWCTSTRQHSEWQTVLPGFGLLDFDWSSAAQTAGSVCCKLHSLCSGCMMSWPRCLLGKLKPPFLARLLTESTSVYIALLEMCIANHLDSMMACLAHFPVRFYTGSQGANAYLRDSPKMCAVQFHNGSLVLGEIWQHNVGVWSEFFFWNQDKVIMYGQKYSFLGKEGTNFPIISQSWIPHLVWEFGPWSQTNFEMRTEFRPELHVILGANFDLT